MRLAVLPLRQEGQRLRANLLPMEGSTMAEERAEIGIFGGSGFYSFLEDVRQIRVHTPYGATSDEVALATLAGRPVAFIPRHGQHHTVPAPDVNYRANIWALKELGATQIIAPCSCGSLQSQIH